MRPYVILMLLGLLPARNCLAAGGATIVVLRGSAKTLEGKPLAEKQKVSPGTTVVTAARSFVRLLFPDNTQLNVGPDSTMKIEVTKPGEASIVDLVGGQLRAKVVKDPVGGEGGPVKDKMVIQTTTAAMGIRGTDLSVSFNRANNITALVTFEGKVAIAKLEPGASAASALRQEKGVHTVGTGQFSGTRPDLPQASIPVKISPAQLEVLKGNDSFAGLGEKANKQAAMASPVPPGVDPKQFASGSEKGLQDSVAQAVGEGRLAAMLKGSANSGDPAGKTPPPEGFFNKSTGEYAPRAGGFLDLASGRYVPPPPSSSYDPNTGTYAPPKALGSIDPSTGMYVPPKGVDLDPVKGFVAEARQPGPDGARMPSGAGSEPPSAITALVVAMNHMTSPEGSTQKVSLDNSLGVGGTAMNGGAPSGLPPPPPPGSLPPPPPNTDPLASQPNSGNCGTLNCPNDSPTTPPPQTGVRFNIHITD